MTNHLARRARRLQSACAPLLEKLEHRTLLSTNVLTWHNDLARDGWNSTETQLTPANVNASSFGKLFTYPVDGQVYAQPLYVANLAIPGQGTHNVVFVATEHDSVYAFDANNNSGPNAGLLWHVSLGTSAATPNNVFGNRYGPYHDINPEVGITGTPVIDLANKTMYVDAFTHDGGSSYSHHIHALDITTGMDRQTPVLVAASVSGNGAGGNGTTIRFSDQFALQRPALTLLNNVLYVAYTGYADTDPYHGWVLGFKESDLSLVSVFNTTPNLLPGGSSNPGEGGIWQSGNGLSSDGSNLFFATGNGDFDPAVGDYGDTVMKLSTSSGLSVADYFTPDNQQSLANADEDLGSGGTLLLPDSVGSTAHPHLMISCGKQGLVYLIDRDNMGKFNSNTNAVVQDNVQLGGGTWDNPAYFNGNIYYCATGDVLRQFSISNAQMSPAPVAQSSNSFGSGSTPSVSSNGNANGIVWTIDNAANVLRAYDATNVANELYDSNQSGTRDQLGSAVKFTTPTIADGEVFVGGTKYLAVFGLLAPPTQPPNAPTNLTASAQGATQIRLQWVDNSNNESGFKILRSTDGANFTQIALASVNSTSFTDTNLSPQTLYYYEVIATNVIGDSAPTNIASATTTAPDAPVDVYHFDEGSGTTTVDSVGGNNGTLIGNPLPQWVAGRIGPHALSFSGDGVAKSTNSQSAVQVQQDLSPILGGTSTLTAWIKTAQMGTGALWADPAITGVEQSGGTDDIRFGYLDLTGRIGVGAGNGPAALSANPINDGTWHHVAFTRDPNSGVVQTYVDGVLSSTATGPTGQITAPFQLIGAQSDVSQDLSTLQGATYFNGQLDDVQIYNVVLSGNEIASLGEVPPAPTGLSATAASGIVVKLKWDPSPAFVNSIEIDRKTGSGGTYAAVATIPASNNSYMDASVTAGNQYFYRIVAIDAAGSSAPSSEVSVTTLMPAVVSHQIFYNNSAWDGNNGTSNVADDKAIATDKQPLVAGQVASYQNYTDYSKGINGIMIDVANLTTIPNASDFTFKAGAEGDPSTWPNAPAPTAVNIYPGRGVNGSARITLLWNDGALVNTWLQVTLLADANTGIAADDQFYYGNLVAETGKGPIGNQFMVTTADQTTVQNDPNTSPGSAPITDPADFNRDKVVDSTDLGIATSSLNDEIEVLNLSVGSIILGSKVNDGSAQRSLVKNVTLTFSRPVTLSASALTLSRRNTGGSGSNDGSPPTDLSGDLSFANPSGDGMNWVVSFKAGTAATDSSGGLADGIYDLTVHASGVSNSAGGTFADQTVTFFRLFGDYNGDGQVNNADYLQFKKSYNSSTGAANFNPIFDSDNNGIINNGDYLQFKKRYGKVFNLNAV